MKKTKRFLSRFAAAAVLVCSVFVGSALQPCLASDSTTYYYGDTDMDGKISAADAALLLKYVRNKDLNIGDIAIAAAGLGLGKVTATNAAMVYKKAADSSYEFPKGDTFEYGSSDPTEDLAETTVFVLGDSTACDYAATADSNYYYKRVGFGTALPSYFNEEKVTVTNLAISGRSSKSFTSEANYETLLSDMKEGDYVLIAFGHNDETANDEARYTFPGGSKETEGSFKYSLYQNYITKIQAAGATPILCTPVVRRTSSDTFSDNQLHKANGGDYAEDIRELAEELDLAVIDNTALTQELYTELTPSNTLYLHAWTSSKETSVDNTHLNNYGAYTVAYMMANALKESESSLKYYVNDSITEPDKDTYLIPNPDYVESTADDYNLGDQTLFDVYDDYWIATAFGNLGGAPNTTNYGVTETNAAESAVESVRLSASNNKGKISGTEDGLLLYAKREVSATESFEISATAVINSYTLDKNAQVAFGVMVADSILVNTNESGYKTHYIAAGIKPGISAEDYDGASSDVNSMIGFYRDADTDKLTAFSTGTADQSNPAEGAEIYFKIRKSGNKYTITIDNYTAECTADYEDLVFPGVFVARNADVTFKDIYFTNEVPED